MQVIVNETKKQSTGKLINKLDHPITVPYGAEALTLSPKAVAENLNRNKLGSIPKGTVFVPYNK